jgi:Family of unknown function (DUF6141)
MPKKEKLIFYEIQKFEHLSVWYVFIGLSFLVTILFTYGMWKQFIWNEPFGFFPVNNFYLTLISILSIGFMFSILALFWLSKLEIQVRNTGLYIKYFPFHFMHRKISLKDLKKVKAKKYDPFKEHGGMGIRHKKNKIIYCIKGKSGILIEYREGKSVILGSQKPEELVQAIKQIL